MGNKMSNPMSQNDTSNVQDIITLLLSQFEGEFAIQFKQAVIANARSSLATEKKVEAMLPNLAIPDYVLKSGMMYKKGDVVKGWKTRFFCARNQADNYAIDYYETESRAKKKGTIQCCCHRVEEFSVEEESVHGKYGIKISPEDDDCRIWWLRCENEDEKADWMKLFMNACQKAMPQVNQDPVVARAFSCTYKILRWRYGFHGWYRSSHTESELLARLCSDVIAKEVTHRVFSDLSNNGQKSVNVKQVQKSLDSAVMEATTKAWDTSLAKQLPLREALEFKVKAVNDLPAQEALLAESISNITEHVVEPFLRNAKQRVCQSVLRSCESTVTNAFVTSVHGFHDYMAEQIREDSFEKDCFSQNITASHRSVEEWWGGPLEDTNQVCWTMYTNDLTDISSFFVAGYSAYNLYSEVLDANRQLMHRALSLFAQKAVDANYLNLTAILKEVLYYVIHDSKIYLKSVLQGILVALLQSSFEADVIMPCLELVQPVQRLIDECPHPDVQELLNLEASTESVLLRRLHDEVNAMVDESHEDNCAEINTTVDLVGATAP